MAPPQYAPGYQPGMFQRSGSGFLGSALTTAAGVAGGMVAANALTSLFSGSGHSGAANAASFVPQGVLPGGQDAAPWATPAVAAPASDPYAQGGEQKDYAADQSWQPAQQDSGWEDAAAETDSGGWSDVDNS
jgi:hypothetical protein